MTTPERPTCPRCANAVSPADAYCAVCGRPLTRVRWRAAGTDASGNQRLGSWQETSGRVAVQRNARHVQIQLVNEGVTAAALVLTDETIRTLPSWILRDGLSERVLHLPPGGALPVGTPPDGEPQRLDLPIDSYRLQQAYDRDAEVGQELVATVTLHGSLQQNLDLDLLLVRQPRLLPGGALYRFLPVELLRAQGVRQTLVLRNESADALELLEVRVRDGGGASPGNSPAGHQRLDATRLLHVSPLDLPLPVAANDERTLPIDLRADEDVELLRNLEAASTSSASTSSAGTSSASTGSASTGDADEPIWFDGRVELRCRHQGEELLLDCRLRGSVGRAPRLVIHGPPELTIPFSRLREKHTLTMRNTGHLPLRLGELHILQLQDGDWRPAPRPDWSPDWLSVRGVELGDLLAAGEERTLELRVDPELRPRHLAGEEWGQRRLVLEHDGFEDRFVLEVSVEFGRVADHFAAGIDFGTSSSVVCILGDERAYPLLLELEQKRPSLASLMYFLADAESPRDGAQNRFLFGQQAHHSAGIDPANLVRSIKTVIARDPATAYNFLYRRGDLYPGNAGQYPGNAVQRARYSAQQLLDIFIGELLGRAERGVTLLDPDAQRDLRLQGERVVFQKAVFSHPVEVTEPMRRALMETAHSVGVNLDQVQVDAFFAERCVDEASAAVLAYVDARERRQVAAGEPFLPIERVLCFDMGGGTTDLAAVEVHDLDRYAGTDPNDVGEDVPVTVELKSNAGRRLGGDDLDVLLAEWLLGQVRGEDRGEAHPAELLQLLDEIRYALQARLFSEFQSGFRQRARYQEPWSSWRDEQLEDLAIDLYSGASGLLRAAEAAKKRLSEAQQASLTLDLGPSLLASVSSAPAVSDISSDTSDASISSSAAEPDFTATIDRATFETLVSARLKAVLPLLDSVVERAGWQWPEVTTLLFTGQGVRVPVIRQRVKEAVAQRRPAEPPLILVEPSSGQAGPDVLFDPKHCVAIGAALWQLSREEGRWLHLRNTLHQRLNFDLQRKAGRRRFRTVPGLERNTALPAEVHLQEPAKIDRLELYRDHQPYVRFQFEPASDLVIQVRGPADLWIVADGKESKGVPLS